MHDEQHLHFCNAGDILKPRSAGSKNLLEVRVEWDGRGRSGGASRSPFFHETVNLKQFHVRPFLSFMKLHFCLVTGQSHRFDQ